MVFGTLTYVFSFLPLLMLYGDKGEFMKSMPTVVSMALLSALLVSNTFTSAHQLLRSARAERV